MTDEPATPDEVLDELFSIGNLTDEQYRAVKRLRADQRQLDEAVRNQAIREAIHKEEIKRLRAVLAGRGPYCAQHGEHQPCSQHNWANF